MARQVEESFQLTRDGPSLPPQPSVDRDRDWDGHHDFEGPIPANEIRF
jgi:hypothetical protein